MGKRPADPQLNPALIQWQQRCKKLAAQICLDSPLLIGVDIPSRAVCAESMVRYGSEERYQFAVQFMEHCLVPEKTIRYLIGCEGQNGSDRLLAVWWYALRVKVATVYTADAREHNRHHDYQELALSGDTLLALLDRPAVDLLADGTLNSDAAYVFTPGYKPFMEQRQHERKMLEEFLAQLKAQADG